MIKYIHGSEDSLDIDIHYVYKELPSFKECQLLSKTKGTENKNLIVINDGVVTDCFKGTIDEVNNGLLATYQLHEQEHELLVNRKVERDLLMKDIRVSRGLLSYFSRTNMRTNVKEALRGSLKQRIDVLNAIDFTLLNTDLGKNYNKSDILKTFAFQFGQVIGLHDGIELYTKSTISDVFEDLRPFLYRENDVDIKTLSKYKEQFLDILSDYRVFESDGISSFLDIGRVIKLKHEKELTEQ